MKLSTPPVLLTLIALAGSCAHPAEKVAAPAPERASLSVELEQHLLANVQVAGEPSHTTLAEHMAELQVPGLSVVVFENYEIVWAATYGVTDAETKDPVTDTTLFQAGSISKSVNALAIMLTAAEGKFELDAPINDILSSWKLPENDLTKKSPVTLRRLLSHNAGTTVHGFPGYAVDAPLPTTAQVLDGAEPTNTPPVRVDVEPGTIVRYSGGGTTITQLALVDTIGKPYPEILQEKVLGPLGMSHSTYEQPLPTDRVAQAAAGHRGDGSVVAGKHHIYPEMAAAGLWTTPTDLATFLIEVTRARANESKHITQAMAKEMTTPVTPEDQAGLGFFMAERNGAMMFGHGGADHGFQANAAASLDGGYGYVVMANSDNGFALFPAIDRTIFAAMGWPGGEKPLTRFALTPEQRDGLLGTFTAEAAGPFSIVSTDDGVALSLPFQPPIALVPVAADQLVRVDNGIRYAFPDADTVDISKEDHPLGSAKRMPADATTPLLELAAGRIDEGTALWKKLVAENPESPIAAERPNMLYAEQLIHEGHYEGALVILRVAREVFPKSSTAAALVGFAKAHTGDIEGAVEAYEQALKMLDSDPAAPEDKKEQWRTEIEVELANMRAK